MLGLWRELLEGDDALFLKGLLEPRGIFNCGGDCRSKYYNKETPHVSTRVSLPFPD